MQISLAVTVFALFFVKLTAKDKRISDCAYTDKLKDPYCFKFKYDEENIFDLRGLLRQRFGIIAAQSNPNNNSICSPMSALIPLGKLALGATSTAFSELKTAIGINVVGKSNTLGTHFSRVLNDLNNLPGVVLDLANRLYVSEKYQLYRKYTRQARKIFKSDVKKVDFNQPKKVAMNINKWVSSKTREMISKIIPSNAITAQTSLVIVSAIYFSGKWKQPFEPSSLGPFYSPYGVRQVKMMSSRGWCDYLNSKALSAQIQDDTADLHGVSQPVVSRTCKKVAEILSRKSREFIKMPTTLNEQQETIRKFRSIANFPTVIGAIDCTHIRVKKVNADGGQLYINRKGFSSINVQLLKIPYAGEGSSFLIVLPRRRNGLRSLLRLLKKSPKLLLQEMRRMGRNNPVKLVMPKFKFESSWDLMKLYKQIGVKAIFNKRKSGLNYIVRNERIYVSSAIQKVVIEVTEQGTAASGSSVVEMTHLSGSDPIIVDRPFLFYVLASDQQLFSGVYTGPSG